jgi:hypothetical protein
MGILTGINNSMGKNTYPPSREIGDHWEWMEYFDGLLRGKHEYVRAEAYKRDMGGSSRAPYVAQPVPFALAQASSNLLFGETPSVVAGDPEDQTNIERIIRDNRLWASSRAGAITTSALGEVFIKVCSDPSTPKGKRSPLIQFIDPRRVIPEFSDTGELLAATIVTTWEESRRTYRLYEVHEPGFVWYELYAGNNTVLGNQVPLDTHDSTLDLNEDAAPTGMTDLAVIHVPNALMTDSPYGISDYANGIDNLFYAFNDATSIAHRATQAGVPFTVMPRELLDDNQNLNHEKTIIAVNQLADTLGEGSISSMIETVQHQANQDKFMAYANEVLDLLLMFSGMNPQSFGRNNDGGAQSGTALKLKMSATLATAAAKGSFFEEGLSEALRLAAQLDSVEVDDGQNVKLAQEWADVESAPTVKLQDGLPDDESQTATIIQALKNAGAISIDQAVRRANPTWTDEQVSDELDRIVAEGDAEIASISSVLPTVQTDQILSNLDGLNPDQLLGLE